jgi:hypothetical protein
MTRRALRASTFHIEVDVGEIGSCTFSSVDEITVHSVAAADEGNEGHIISGWLHLRDGFISAMASFCRTTIFDCRSANYTCQNSVYGTQNYGTQKVTPEPKTGCRRPRPAKASPRECPWGVISRVPISYHAWPERATFLAKRSALCLMLPFSSLQRLAISAAIGGIRTCPAYASKRRDDHGKSARC